MMVALPNNALTATASRSEIAGSSETAATLALRNGVNEGSIYNWKGRENFHDASHTSYGSQTTLTSAQELIMVEQRKKLLRPFADLLAVASGFLCPQATCSSLDRCFRSYGVGNFNAIKPKEPALPHKAFKSIELGLIHIDIKYLPQMHGQTSRRYLFVNIDRATRWGYVQIKIHKTAAATRSFLNTLHKTCQIKMEKILTDNGKDFTKRLLASRERQASGNHEFDQLCQDLNIEHRLTKPRTIRTNSMVESLNWRMADLLKTHRFTSGEDLEQTLMRYVALYKHQLSQPVLKSKTPMRAMKDWFASHPLLFVKRP